MRGLLATIAVVLVEFALLATVPAGPVPAGILALLAATVVVALWQRYRRSEREREAAVHRERVRLARDMHDRIGRRLGLAALQAAALEVRETDARRRGEARQVGDSVRAAVEDLHGLVAVLRGDETADERPLFDPAAAAALASQFVESGVAVELRQSGAPGPVPAAGASAAYAVLEEGMANAVKHASGRPITATVTWEDDALLVAVENPLAEAARGAAPGGHGLTGLRERVDAAGGLLDCRVEDGRFRLSAMLPRASGARAALAAARVPRPVRVAAFVTVIVLLAMLPLSVFSGVQT
ncbi:sensor histidine kinase [Glycomyces harbinensis]|uniref:histidine kinase n=1 Tax=Glycomyces harbinensis TaxID=58114 RepID=A0A1G6V2E5_9ACTN|nr:histidine kinase [Glycomyces harbinensis]SDD47157.1 Histidine kinase [Glycomyces harbinensis]